MDRAQRDVVAVHHVGGGANERMMMASGWKTMRVVFHKFAELPQSRNQTVESGEIECHGHNWKIQLYPRGEIQSTDDDQISLRLRCCDPPPDGLNVKFNIDVLSAEYTVKSGKWFVFKSRTSNWGWQDYARRSHVLDTSKNFLQDGNLTVDVVLKVQREEPTIWTPSNTVCSDMLKVMNRADAENADVHFSVISQDEENANSSFHAHRAILAVRCPALAELAEDCDVEKPIPIQDVSPDMFRMLLRFIYGGEIPPKAVLMGNSRAIIRAANEYGCTGLKLAAEAELARDGIATENAAELILFADATNCALLKEVAMEYFVANAEAVMASTGYEQVAESPAILREMMTEMVSGSKKRSSDDTVVNEREYKRMRVATLRQELDTKGLDVDGSKEMLVSRLEKASVAQAEKEAAEAGDGHSRSK